MLSKFEYDGGLNPNFRTGAFCLPVQQVTAYVAQPVRPRIAFLSCAAVTRPGRPGLDPESVRTSSQHGNELVPAR